MSLFTWGMQCVMRCGKGALNKTSIQFITFIKTVFLIPFSMLRVFTATQQ